jgi:hypothetical protein
MTPNDDSRVTPPELPKAELPKQADHEAQRMPTNTELWHQLSNALCAAIAEDERAWTIFSVFLGANAILIYTFSISLNQSLVACVISFIGVISCAGWWIIQSRALRYRRYRENVVRRLEEYLLGQSHTEIAIFPTLRATGGAVNMPARQLTVPAPGGLFHFWSIF